MNPIKWIRGQPRPSADEIARLETLDDLFIEAWKLGRLYVAHMNSGWHASITLPSSNPHVKAEVGSEFGHKTPHDAIRQVVRRALGFEGAE